MCWFFELQISFRVWSLGGIHEEGRGGGPDVVHTTKMKEGHTTPTRPQQKFQTIIYLFNYLKLIRSVGVMIETLNLYTKNMLLCPTHYNKLKNTLFTGH